MKSLLLIFLFTISIAGFSQVVAVSPVSDTKCPTDSLVLRATASGGTGILTYRWYISTAPTDTLSISDTLLLLHEDPSLHGSLSTYVCQVTDGAASTAMAQSFIFVTAPIDFTVGADTLKCPADIVRITGRSSRSDLVYDWNTLVIDNLIQEDTNAYYDINKAGLYWVIASPPPSSGFCPALDSIVVINHIEALSLQVVPAQSCVGDSVILSNESDYPIGSNLLWINSAITTQTKINASGTYNLSITTPAPYYCFIEDSITVIQTEYPTVNLIDDSTVCSGDSLLLTNLAPQVNVSTPNWSYNGAGTDQTDGLISDSIWVSNEGRYSLLFTSNDGVCTTLDSVQITSLDLAFELDFDTLYCDTNEINLFPTGQDVGTYSYLWNSSIADDTLIVNQTGNYSLLISSAIGCQSTNDIDLVFVKPVEFEVISLDSDSSYTVIDLNDHIDLTNVSTVWENEFADTISELALTTFIEDGTYTLSTSHDLYDCTASFETAITLTPDAINYELFVPSAFSPSNSIDRNQKLYLEGNAISEEGFSFKVYNKWGTLVYDNSSFSDMNSTGWDGTNNSNSLNSGTYTYTITGSYLNGEAITRSGSITYFR